MKTQTEKSTLKKSKAVASDSSDKKNKKESEVQFHDNRAESVAQRKLEGVADKSSNSGKIAQLQAIANDLSPEPVQKRGLEEEEMLQGSFETIQKQEPEDEELLQGKFEAIQKLGLEEEEEPLQGKFEAIQKQEKEELLQGKFETIQKQEDEEELLQGKFETVQKQGLEEEEIQAKSYTVQKKDQKPPNNTGLPENLKSGIENLSGVSLDDVTVHYNSDKPVKLQAHAYAQGANIYMASGQEKHLPHEAWHVVQQKQGRVKPTLQMMGRVNVNDDEVLEKEADEMGKRALQLKTVAPTQLRADTPQLKSLAITQLMPSKDAKFIEGLFSTYYSIDDGSRNSDYATKLKGLYSSLGQAQSGDYLTEEIDTGEFDTFKAGNEDYHVNPQKNKAGDRPGLEKGNYFHIHNDNKNKDLEQEGTARRIIVNIKTQKDAFALSKGLLDLFKKSNAFSPFIKEFKVYLANLRKAKVKKDKIVVYYNFNIEDKSADTVGDAIVSKIESIADENALVDDFAPFYEGVSKGIAWAEEPKHHSDLRGSFTRTRVNVIESVIKANASVSSPEDLVTLVDAALKAANIDMDNPARHTSK